MPKDNVTAISLTEAADRLLNGNRVLIFIHQNPDGDAVGSGDIVLMSVPLAYGLSDYRDSLRTYLERSRGWADYTYLSGHCHQQKRADGTENPPCRALIEDMEALCGRLLAGDAQGEEVQEIFAPDGRAFRAYCGRAGIVYTAEQLK